MESFFLAETVKYLWLLFDLAAGPDNLVENGPYNTEGHLLPMTPRISLAREHCSYFGAYCKNSNFRPTSYTSNDGHQTNSSSRFQRGVGSTSYVTQYGFRKSTTSMSGIIKGLCPGLTHEQMYGLSYAPSPDMVPQEEPTDHVENGGGQSQSMVVLSDSP
ncbi:hypothetical protein M8C21_000772 [Ambrosia artemisiifolia]|uniref:Uncharacterized protein n=1 Tax=Ambrosia artemisiifolia TaxID=4212 RepID=A0AAD5CKM2_AMBAR|nr:hypothetical protein M8C21_000772 [Ambrosia artemisiifolia]